LTYEFSAFATLQHISASGVEFNPEAYS